MFTVVTGVGYTGRRVLEMLPADNSTGLSRSRVDTQRQVLELNLDEGDALPLTLPAQHAVIYTVPPRGNPDRRLEHFLPLVDPERFVYISTTGVYGDYSGRAVDEDSELRPSNERAERRVAAEQLLVDWARERNCALVILRAPGIYGPGRLGVERLRAGVPVLDEEDANPGNRIHVDDLARCCVAALSESVPAGIYNVGDGDHRSSTAFSSEITRQLGLPEPPRITLQEARRQFSPERLSFLADSRVVDTRKMRDVLGVTPRYTDPADGIRASLAD